jgi:hypothetical protein
MRRRLLTVGAAVVVALAPVAWFAFRPGPPGGPPAPAVSTTTAPVTRGDVTQRVQVAGTLGYDGGYRVVNQLPPGIVTGMVGPGTTVARGGTLYSVSGDPVVLLYGASPAYRDFTVGMSDGPDVRQLEQNLVALGAARSVTVDDRFTRATAEAIARWQRDRGLPAARRTGSVRLGQVVFLPGAVRVTEVTTPTGSSVAPGGPVLSATSTAQVVLVQLTTDRQHLLRVGNEVQVLLPGGTGAVPGTVTNVGRVATVDAPGAPGGSRQATVPVTIAVRLPEGAGDLDQTPVQVAITTARHGGVLMVPVTALLAKAGGGYQVRVVTPTGVQPVDVTPGLYDDSGGTVEVTGAGLAEGATVEVPAT